MMRAQYFGGACVLLLALSSVATAAGESPLIEAVKKADRDAVRVLVRRGDIDAPQPDGTTALHWAVRRDDVETVDLLIHAGANIKAVNRYGVTPLWLACVNGGAEIVERLLKAGADPNTTMQEGDTALMTAARAGNVAAIKALLAHGAQVNTKEQWKGQTALMWAAAEGRTAVVRALVERGADVRARSTGEGGFTALLFAVREGNLDAVRVLLDSGADVNEALTDGTSALSLAVASAHYDLGAFLLERGADPNNDVPGWTALHRVTWMRRPYHGTNNPFPVPTGTMDSLEFVKALLAHGANPDARLKKAPDQKYVGRDVVIDGGVHIAGSTPFFLAARNDDLPLMRLLLSSGADYRAANDERTTPLMAAAGVTIRAKGENPGTPEEAAEAVKFCLDLGGDATTVDANGWTALHGAANRGSNQAVMLLLNAGAKLDARNNVGWTPWRIAAGVIINITVMRSPETAALLRQLMEARGMTIDDSVDVDEGNTVTR